MQPNDSLLCELEEEVGRVGSYVIRICKKSAILFKFINIRSATSCNTRWTTSLMWLSRHLKISSGLEPISAEENTYDMEKILT